MLFILEHMLEVTIDYVHKFLRSGCFQLFALLRISECIFTSNQAPALLFQEVSINKTHIGFYIKDLKTDQYKRGTKFTDFKHTLYLRACTNFCQFRPQIQGRFFLSSQRQASY